MSEKYDNYLKEHIGNVKKGYEWMKTHLPAKYFDFKEDETWNISQHDLSKYGKEEYDAYDEYFYGGYVRTKDKFNKAWLHHIHNNPHHWQYWMLFEDDPNGSNDYICIEMPHNYVIEMIADWWSFSWKSKNLYEIFDWYNKHLMTIKLHEKTRKHVEKILSDLKDAINKEVFEFVENKYPEEDVSEFLHSDADEEKLINDLLDEIGVGESI